MDKTTGELLGSAWLDFSRYGTEDNPKEHSLYLNSEKSSHHELNVQLIGQEEVTEEMIQSKR
jgi:hypothetical protein